MFHSLYLSILLLLSKVKQLTILFLQLSGVFILKFAASWHLVDIL